MLSAITTATKETRKVGKQSGGDSGFCLSGDLAEVRVHLYERSVPEEPDRRARAVNANDVRTALDTGAAFGGVTGIAPSRRMIVNACGA